MTSSFICRQDERLDTFLSKKLSSSRNQIAHLIKDGNVNVDDQLISKPSYKLKVNQTIHVTLPTPQTSEAQPVDFTIETLYEDDDILIINKPLDIVVHPAPSVKEATVVDWLKEQNIRLSTLNGEERHGIVHRLDKGTTGALVVAKNNHAHQHLSKQLEERTMGRYYLAIVEAPFHEKRTVEAPIARHPKQRTKMAIVPTGREAKTEFVPIDVSTNGKYILLACKLYTGRTHQIRVHLQSINRPILGDNLYGFKSKNNKINRIMLHASLMYLNHPKNGTLLHIQAPIETDMNKFIKNEFSERIYEKILAEQLIHYFDTHTF